MATVAEAEPHLGKDGPTNSTLAPLNPKSNVKVPTSSNNIHNSVKTSSVDDAAEQSSEKPDTASLGKGNAPIPHPSEEALRMQNKDQTSKIATNNNNPSAVDDVAKSSEEKKLVSSAGDAAPKQDNPIATGDGGQPSPHQQKKDITITTETTSDGPSQKAPSDEVPSETGIIGNDQKTDETDGTTASKDEARRYPARTRKAPTSSASTINNTDPLPPLTNVSKSARKPKATRKQSERAPSTVPKYSPKKVKPPLRPPPPNVIPSKHIDHSKYVCLTQKIENSKKSLYQACIEDFWQEYEQGAHCEKRKVAARCIAEMHRRGVLFVNRCKEKYAGDDQYYFVEDQESRKLTSKVLRALREEVLVRTCHLTTEEKNERSRMFQIARKFSQNKVFRKHMDKFRLEDAKGDVNSPDFDAVISKIEEKAAEKYQRQNRPYGIFNTKEIARFAAASMKQSSRATQPAAEDSVPAMPPNLSKTDLPTIANTETNNKLSAASMTSSVSLEPRSNGLMGIANGDARTKTDNHVVGSSATADAAPPALLNTESGAVHLPSQTCDYAFLPVPVAEVAPHLLALLTNPVSSNEHWSEQQSRRSSSNGHNYESNNSQRFHSKRKTVHRSVTENMDFAGTTASVDQCNTSGKNNSRHDTRTSSERGPKRRKSHKNR